MVGNGYCEIAMPDTERWHSFRRSGVGASEWAAALGRSRYKPTFQLWAQKRGEAEPDDENELMTFGRLIEPSIIKLWEHENGRRVERYPVPLLQDVERPFLLATPDALITKTEALEAKSTGEFAVQELGAEGTDEVHEEWIWQAQAQCYVARLDYVEFTVLVGRKLRRYAVERNEKLIQWGVRGVTEFWQRVLDNDPPPLDYQHHRAIDALRSLYPKVEETRVQLSEEDLQLREEYERLNAEIKERDARKKEITARLLHRIGEHGGGLLPDGEHELRRIAIAEKEIAYTRKASVQLRRCKVKQ